MLIISLLGGVSHLRFHRLLKNQHYNNEQQEGPFITSRLRYFQDLNLLLSVTLFIFAFCFILLSADGLTAAKTINQHKFSSDFIICNSKYLPKEKIPVCLRPFFFFFLVVNVMCIAIWTIVVLIFHPNKQQARLKPNQVFDSYNSYPSGTVKSVI